MVTKYHLKISLTWHLLWTQFKMAIYFIMSHNYEKLWVVVFKNLILHLLLLSTEIFKTVHCTRLLDKIFNPADFSFLLRLKWPILLQYPRWSSVGCEAPDTFWIDITQEKSWLRPNNSWTNNFFATTLLFPS